MLGAIAGDIIGSVFEQAPLKSKDFELFTAESRFTDDTVLSVAIAAVLMQASGDPQSFGPQDFSPQDFSPQDFSQSIRRYAQAYPKAGYGKSFKAWAAADTPSPYNSWGNGSAMRVSSVGFAHSNMVQVRQLARQTAEVTHNHPEGIKGAEATAAMILLARELKNKNSIRASIESTFGYDLSRTVEQIRPNYHFDVSCQGSVPEAMIAFLDSTDFEDAIRNAVSLGGDADTMACIAGAIAEAFYGGVPQAIAHATLTRLDAPLRRVTLAFCERYTRPYSFSDI